MKVAFYKDKSAFLDRLISWWMRGDYSHCEIVVRDLPTGESYCYSSSRQDGGVRGKAILLDPTKWDLLEVDGDSKQVESWFLSKSGCKYDLVGLLGFVFRRVGADKSKYFCSEAVASSLGFEDSWRFDPNALYAALERKYVKK